MRHTLPVGSRKSCHVISLTNEGRGARSRAHASDHRRLAEKWSRGALLVREWSELGQRDVPLLAELSTTKSPLLKSANDGSSPDADYIVVIAEGPCFKLKPGESIPTAVLTFVERYRE